LTHRADGTAIDAGAPVTQATQAIAVSGVVMEPAQNLHQQSLQLLLFLRGQRVHHRPEGTLTGIQKIPCEVLPVAGERDRHVPASSGAALEKTVALQTLNQAYGGGLGDSETSAQLAGPDPAAVGEQDQRGHSAVAELGCTREVGA
jgi:hypothetical protein